eukprot:3183593-Ditylum_brightwellii.AAC.1
MGLLCFPSLRDYWDTVPDIPQYMVMKELNITCDYFLFLWCNFCVYDEEDINVQEEENEYSNEDDESEHDIILELTFDYNQQGD